ncbi:MAG: hypothetical protein IMF19_14100, partial [Proteobacteria bacterium]|nr:hypothetical protein [Pseudomonadota bacterium]
MSVSDTMMHGAVENMFGLFKKAEGLGVNLEKIFAGAGTAKQKRRTVGGLERRLGMPKMSVKEKEMIKEEGAKLYREKRPEAGEKEIAKYQEEYLYGHRKQAIEQHVKATAPKKQLMMDIFPGMGMGRERIIPPKEPSMPPTGRGKPGGPLMLPPGYGYIPEPDVPDIGVTPTTL